MRRPSPKKKPIARPRRRDRKPNGARVRKLAVSFERGLADDIVAAAKAESGGNVSAWLAEAARRSLKHTILTELFEDMVREAGPPDPEDVAYIDSVWPK